MLVGARVPCEDEKWQLYITLLEIEDVVFSPAITANKAAFLKDLIEDHHIRFVQLCPGASVIPKMHHDSPPQNYVKVYASVSCNII